MSEISQEQLQSLFELRQLRENNKRLRAENEKMRERLETVHNEKDNALDMMFLQKK